MKRFELRDAAACVVCLLGDPGSEWDLGAWSPAPRARPACLHLGRHVAVSI